MLHLDKNVAKAKSKLAAATPAVKSEPVKPQHDKAALHSQLKDLKGQFDPSYQHSDDHSVYTKHRDIHAKITDIEKKLRESEELDKTEIDELSKATLTSYANKSARKVAAFEPEVKRLKGEIETHSRGVGYFSRQAAKHRDPDETPRSSEVDKKRADADAKTADDHAAYHSNMLSKFKGTSDAISDKLNKRKSGVAKAVARLTKESEELEELSKDTLGNYIGKADKEVSDLRKKSDRSKNLQRAYDLLGQAQKRRAGSNKAVSKLSRKLAGERWGVTESEAHAADLEEAIVVHSSKEKDGKEYQVLSRKNNREFVIQSKKKDGSWHTHDAVGNVQRARQLIITGRYSDVSEAVEVQTVTITVPALIRLCEIAREEIDGDTELHEYIESLIEGSNGTIDSQLIDDVLGEATVKEGVVVSADRKMGKDGRLYPAHRTQLGTTQIK
jgi:hypothetical protein